MSGFMRQLKQNNERASKSRFKQPIKYNQGSVVSLQSTLYNVNPQKCHGNNRLVNNTPNNPRSINKLHDPSCDYSCGPSSVIKKTNLSNRNLVDNRISTRSDLCYKKKNEKKYQTNGDLIDQLKSQNLACSKKQEIVDYNNCDLKRTVYDSMRQYNRCNIVKNTNTLDSSELITLIRAKTLTCRDLIKKTIDRIIRYFNGTAFERDGTIRPHTHGKVNQKEDNANFGRSVAISDKFIVVGAPLGDANNLESVGGIVEADQGYVEVFEHQNFDICL